MIYPITYYRTGPTDLSDFVLIMDAEQERKERAKGFKHLGEFFSAVGVAEIQQIAHNDTTPKRRGRPPKVNT